MWCAKRQRMYEDDDDENHFNDSNESSNDDDSIDETSIKYRLQKVLKIFESIGATEFVISGTLSDAPLHVIFIKQNRKLIRFPLFEEDLLWITDVFKQSPYGKGTETILDASFRNSWHLDPDDFEIMNPKWNTYVNDILVARIRQEMAIKTTFKASLYKLLLYKSGSFFKPHRDTEKEEGMFATLVVQLPSRFDGGQLVVEHDNKTKKIDFSTNIVPANMYTTFFSTFYCDCKHEILPVTDGIRICLVYNLVMSESDTSRELPTAPMVSDVLMEIANVCDEWRKTNIPSKVVYGLSHKYTERSLSYKNLKSSDKSVANALVKFSKEHSLVVFLGTLEKTWQGDETFLDDESTEEDVEIYYRLKHLEMIGHSIIGVPELSGMSVNHDNEMISKDCFRNVTPFDKQREETGNEGTTVTLSYRHSALVVFPIENAFDIMMRETKDDEAERIFIGQCKQLRSDGQNDDTKQKLLRWAHQLIPTSSWQRKTISLPFLSAISELNDLPVLQKFLDNYLLDEEAVDSVVILCDTYGWNVLGEHLVIGFKKLNQETALKVLDLLVGNPADFVCKDEKKKLCQTLMELIPSSNASGYRYRYPKVDFLYKFCALAKRMSCDPSKHLAALRIEINEESVDPIVKLCETYGWNVLQELLVIGFKNLEQETALKVLNALVGNPADFSAKDEKKKICVTLIDLIPKLKANYRQSKEEFIYEFCVLAQRINYDIIKHLAVHRIEIMVPVLVKLASTTKNILEQHWRGVAQHFLSKMQSLATSSDQTPVWTCNDRILCVCEDCVVLSTFMKVNKKTTEFRVIKKRRLHLEKIVNGINNLTFTTESSGRPQKMVVTKTMPSSYIPSQEQIVARESMSKLTSILQLE